MKLDLRSKWWTISTLVLGGIFIAWSWYLLLSVDREQELVQRNVGIIGKLSKLEGAIEELEAGMFGFSDEELRAEQEQINNTLSDLQSFDFISGQVTAAKAAVGRMDSIYGVADVSRDSAGNCPRGYGKLIAEQSYLAQQAVRGATSVVRGMQGKIAADLAGKWTELHVMVSVACVSVVIIILLLIVTQRNIRKRMELNAMLENLVKERTAELERTNRRLVVQIEERIKAEEMIREAEKKLIEKVRDLDMFFYRSSHDLKGPLASMQGLLRIAAKEVKDPLAHQYFGMLKQSSDKLHQTLLGLIEVVNVTQGKIQPEPIDLAQLIDEIVAGLDHLPERKGITITREVHFTDKIMADKTVMRSVLQNLVHNAIVYRRKDFSGSFIRITADKRPDAFVIVVEDNGIGIPAAMREKVFEVFFRANSDSTGSGLGLYIVKSVLEKMHATISLKSDENVGTTFTIRIPLK